MNNILTVVCEYYSDVLCSDHPLFLAYVLLSLMALFKSYPSVGDLVLPLSLLPLWSHTFRCEQPSPHHTPHTLTDLTTHYIPGRPAV